MFLRPPTNATSQERNHNDRVTRCTKYHESSSGYWPQKSRGEASNEEERNANAIILSVAQVADMEGGGWSNPLCMLDLCGTAHLVFPKSTNSYYK